MKFDIMITTREGSLVFVDAPPEVEKTVRALQTKHDQEAKDLRCSTEYLPWMIREWIKEGLTFAFDGGQ